MELCPGEVQKPTEERVWRKREAPVDMCGNQYTLARSRLWLPLSLRQPRRPLCNQPGLLRVGQILLADKDRIQSPWIQPGGNPERDDDPQLGFLPFAAPVAFLACSSAIVLSFTMVRKRRYQRRRRLTRCRSREERRRGRRAQCKHPAPSPYRGSLPSD